jgi:DNA polymerase
VNRDEAVLRELGLYPLWQRRTAEAVAEMRQVSAAVSQPMAVPPQAPAAAIAPAVVADTSSGSRGQHTDTMNVLDWTGLKAVVKDCTSCKLRAGCKQTVFGVGDEKAGWLFVGEGPGADEDVRGEPFVGQAGKLLDNMLLALKLKRGNDVYIANIVKCRPPGNRTPEPGEAVACFPYLQRQIELIQPKIIVALGKTAATTLLNRDATLGSLRGQVHDYRGTPLVVTYHPAYLLRTLADKAKAWQDLCLAAQLKAARS